MTPPPEHETTRDPSVRAEIVTGVRLSLPAGLGIVPLGIAFGLLVIQHGLSWWVAPALSFMAYAGSLELLLVGMIATVTPVATIALTTLLVNFRHVFYALSFPLRVVRGRLARLYSVYALTDETYAVTAAAPGTWTHPRLLAAQVALQVYWVGGGLLGVLIGSLLSGPIEGLEFALCALFITLTLDACRTRAQVPSLLLAGLAFGFALVLTPDAVLFTAMAVFVGLLVVRYVIERARGADGMRDSDA
ncbi:AzlC family ABC transporter permease [Gordonia shandongensis]|uniref:AzlC family ABC transporter permease n=1 Tax=Gordonia shandongensis TaxID=376351 RepID=UPI0004202EA7|nr:AzlC family ABC transporter permease [Gordonia shandongensis]